MRMRVINPGALSEDDSLLTLLTVADDLRDDYSLGDVKFITSILIT